MTLNIFPDAALQPLIHFGGVLIVHNSLLSVRYSSFHHSDLLTVLDSAEKRIYDTISRSRIHCFAQQQSFPFDDAIAILNTDLAMPRLNHGLVVFDTRLPLNILIRKTLIIFFIKVFV